MKTLGKILGISLTVGLLVFFCAGMWEQDKVLISGSSIIFEGDTIDGICTTLIVEDPIMPCTITLAASDGEVALMTTTFKSYWYKSRDSGSGQHYIGGYYNCSDADANLSDSSPTITYGGVNAPYAAHALIVSGGNGTTDGTTLILTVSGTSITDAGVRTTSDSQIIEATALESSLNSYYETNKKWLGQITFTLTSDGSTFSYDFNYGFCKYDDFGNRNFTLTDYEAVGIANSNDSGFNIELIHHSSTGWIYDTSSFSPGGTILLDMNSIHGVEQDLDNGEEFAFKRAGMSTYITGDNSEGLLIRITTAINLSIAQMESHIGVILDQ